MSDTHPSVAAEAKAAATEFLAGFRTFREETAKRMAEMGTRIEAIDRKSAEIRRPALATGSEMRAPHQKAFAAYLRRGDEDSLRSLEVEAKGLNTQVAAEGGYLVDPKTSEMIGTVLRSGGSIRALANVVQVEAGVYDVLVDHTDLGAGWQDEVAPAAETSAPLVDRISIALHELSAAPTASQRILDDAAFDVEAWLAERIADRFLRAEAAAFVAGDGVAKPKGFLTKPTVANGAWSWGNIGYVATGTSGDFDPNDPADALIETVYALPARVPRRRRLCDELEDGGRGPQDEGRAGPVPVVRGPAERHAAAAVRLSGAGRRGHAGHRAGRARDRLRQFREGLHDRRAAGPAHPARSVLGQAERDVLCDQARRRRRHRLCGDQDAEVRRLVTPAPGDPGTVVIPAIARRSPGEPGA